MAGFYDALGIGRFKARRLAMTMTCLFNSSSLSCDHWEE
jgi:hypothetical protein